MSDISTEFVTCRCVNCDGHIQFEKQHAGSSVDCPHCGKKTLLFTQSIKQATLLLKEQPSTFDCYYTFTLSPGLVRYSFVDTFLKTPVEEMIECLKSFSEHPAIQTHFWMHGYKVNPRYMSPDDHGTTLSDVDGLLQGCSWENRLRIEHRLGRLYLSHKLPAWAFRSAMIWLNR